MKLKEVTLKNFRGAKGDTPLVFNFNNNSSALIYGNNGSGKSSFSDAIEWIVNDKVEHLKGAEVENHGGLKNTFASEKDESYVQIKLGKLDIKKHLIQKKDKFSSKFDNDKIDEESFLALRSERLSIRNQELVEFVLATSGDRLADISEIIGFQDIKNTKDILSKTVNSLNKTLKIKSYETNISAHKNKILEKLKATVNTREQLYSSINSELKKVGINTNVLDKNSLDLAMTDLKKGVNEQDIIKRNNIDICTKNLETVQTKIVNSKTSLDSFLQNIQKLKADSEKLSSISLTRLLEEGNKIISASSENNCPLCIREIDKEILLKLIKDRLATLKGIQTDIENLESEKRQLHATFSGVKTTVDDIFAKISCLRIDSVDNQLIETTKQNITAIETELNLALLTLNLEKLSIDDSTIPNFEMLLKNLRNIEKGTENNIAQSKIDLFSAIQSSYEAYSEIEKLEKEKGAIESQIATMTKVLYSFNDVRTKEMNKFLSSISQSVNEYYVYMYQGERVDEIQLVPKLDSFGDLTGISIELKFHGKPVSSPKKFLSESYINCLGLCIFLASVKLYNKNAKFFILDDVISSFDKPHRLRFSQLLADKFTDYQIIALTHEKEWFEIMKNSLKGNGWIITEVKWDIDSGTYLDKPSSDLKEEIELKLKNKSESGLGNLIRRYAEKCFKAICYNLEIPLKFRYNSDNENRMSGELFPAIVARTQDKTEYLKDNSVVKKLKVSSFITNKTSHDSSFRENIDDLKVAYQDLSEFYNLFFCNEDKCNSLISVKNATDKKISCNCGKKFIDWKT